MTFGKFLLNLIVIIFCCIMYGIGVDLIRENAGYSLLGMIIIQVFTIIQVFFCSGIWE